MSFSVYLQLKLSFSPRECKCVCVCVQWVTGLQKQIIISTVIKCSPNRHYGTDRQSHHVQWQIKCQKMENKEIGRMDGFWAVSWIICKPNVYSAPIILSHEAYLMMHLLIYRFSSLTHSSSTAALESAIIAALMTARKWPHESHGCWVTDEWERERESKQEQLIDPMAKHSLSMFLHRFWLPSIRLSISVDAGGAREWGSERETGFSLWCVYWISLTCLYFLQTAIQFKHDWLMDWQDNIKQSRARHSQPSSWMTKRWAKIKCYSLPC